MSDIEDNKESDVNKCINPLYIANKRTKEPNSINLITKNNLAQEINKITIKVENKTNYKNLGDDRIVDNNINPIDIANRIAIEDVICKSSNSGTSEIVKNDLTNLCTPILSSKSISTNNINSIHEISKRYSFVRNYHSTKQLYDGQIQYNNCPEKIASTSFNLKIFCIDISDSMAEENFETVAGEKLTNISLIRRALSMFLHTKASINVAHQYALVFLSDVTIWMCDFTTDVDKIITILENFHDFLPAASTSCDFNQIFEMMSNLHAVKNIPKLTYDPYYCVRLIVIYARPNSMPTFDKEVLAQLFNKQLIFIDVLYLYEYGTISCDQIYRKLCELDLRNEISYMFSVCHSPSLLYEKFSRLLSHPLQRRRQQNLVLETGS